ncbi:hypothetical protein CDAR_173021 [Caerostris darwini]|uniref:Uncharacterized protein n=1 Tax=Caerostris darwini TaxID=1538125 RepID=A0AAV4S193_9ARAC|nr:hypothetical protein CDAR_173021 [Caerostris darwini]
MSVSIHAMSFLEYDGPFSATARTASKAPNNLLVVLLQKLEGALTAPSISREGDELWSERSPSCVLRLDKRRIF